MKTIETAAKEYVINLSEPRKFGNIKTPRGAGIELMEAFKGGVEFAQQWISVDDELPPDGKVFIKITIKGDADFDDSYDYSVGVFYKGNWDVFFGKNRPITHWRPIEIK